MRHALVSTKGYKYMELFNKSGLLVSSLLVAVGALIACQAHEDAMPPANVIEAAALHIGPVGQSAAERRLREWAEQGSPVAQRELALRYQADPSKHSEAVRLLERAARAGDSQAAVNLETMYRQASALNSPATANELSASRMLKDVIAPPSVGLSRY